jgi:hypothetical protein
MKDKITLTAAEAAEYELHLDMEKGSGLNQVEAELALNIILQAGASVKLSDPNAAQVLGMYQDLVRKLEALARLAARDFGEAVV